MGFRAQQAWRTLINASVGVNGQLLTQPCTLSTISRNYSAASVDYLFEQEETEFFLSVISVCSGSVRLRNFEQYHNRRSKGAGDSRTHVV